ncbi:5'-nucleotidase C-terminal domain-containing protein [bacterium]|nr:5'-nucleotidase C-terminal domain-containing protein [bacterium]MDB4088599.1 5'-nucleotidase C-terminal domain-containing protein [Flavobacteriales bacterium]
MNKKSYIFFAVFFIFIGCRPYHLYKSEEVNTSITKSEEVDSSLIQIYKPYKTSLDSSMNEVLNVSMVEMSTGSPEGLLGDFVCDLSLKIGNELYKENTGKVADFVLLNNGGLRTFLPKGEITRRKIYELMPFENELVVVTLSAEKANELFGYIARKTVNGGTRKQGVPISGNVKVVLQGKIPKDIIINNSPFVGKEYKVITSDYLANGGDNMTFFLNPIKIEKIGIKLRDAIMQHVIDENKAGNPLNAVLDKRISYVE